ncbi:histone-binding protein SET3 NDAI_0B05130 [Naumovozyma dairenensis CBS 421]|uniref:SET domain-containing protein n=1 Tax=Naumovozyma dairenensis (strain ATCC 10597 / BCRC 20456 / CBS 421 / NBRC 0211 / NRRL Y-12639) TaxID=1071378 RepID=G0W6Y5_NAUDC|nr:hypothetical protein NDAI_0B05130 [Naumovozyma dairenensis CBS 421]CCD23546.1 hypothetical protein NDAI_0B05130 [Naumovozyma dairenensis CBS 421]
MDDREKEQSQDDTGLLADASTLLMFSKSTAPRPSESSTASNELPSMEHALEEQQRQREHVHHHSHKHRRESLRPLDAAASAAATALATAATVPLPLLHKKLKKTASNKLTEEEEMQKEIFENKEGTQVVDDSYIVDPDSGIITCICGFDDDDGFTIQCDHCNRWQHAICFGIKDVDSAPDDHLCDVCQPGNDIDRKLARRKQLQQRSLLGLNNLPELESRSENGNFDFDNHESSPKKDVKINANNKGRSQSNADKVAEDIHLEEMENDNDEKHTDDGRISSRPSVIDIPVQSPDLVVRKKEHFLTAKEAFQASFLPIDNYRTKDKLVDLFIKKHSNDEFIEEVPSFKPISFEVKPYADFNYSRVFPGFTKLGIFIQENCNENALIEEFLGEIDFKNRYLNNSRNQYNIWGCTKRKVLFHPHWPIYIDARASGNLTRYLRRGCNPNVELITIKVNNEIKFVLKAIKDIEKGEELQIAWNWNPKHPILKLIDEEDTFETLTSDEKVVLLTSIDSVLGSCECACGKNSKECHLSKIKKLSKNMVKSLKVKMNNRYKFNMVLDDLDLRKRRPGPVLDRLVKKSIDRRKRHKEGNLLKILLEELDPASLKDDIKFDENVTNRPMKTLEKERRNVTTKKNKEGTIHPFKIWLLSCNKIGKPTVHRKKTNIKIIENLEDLNESRITDLDKLSIPIKLEVQPSTQRPSLHSQSVHTSKISLTGLGLTKKAESTADIKMRFDGSKRHHSITTGPSMMLESNVLRGLSSPKILSSREKFDGKPPSRSTTPILLSAKEFQDMEKEHDKTLDLTSDGNSSASNLPASLASASQLKRN